MQRTRRFLTTSKKGHYRDVMVMHDLATVSNLPPEEREKFGDSPFRLPAHPELAPITFG